MVVLLILLLLVRAVMVVMVVVLMLLVITTVSATATDKWGVSSDGGIVVLALFQGPHRVVRSSGFYFSQSRGRVQVCWLVCVSPTFVV